MSGAAPQDERGGSGGDVHTLLRGALLEAFEAQRLGRAPGEPVRVGLATVCADARRRGVPVVQLLVALKDAWRALPPVSAMGGREAEAALARVVTLCIQEFYRRDGRPEDGPFTA